MSTHTTGPWNCGIAKSGWCIWQDVPGRKDIEKTRANARLIAAAPELLTALELAEGWIDAHRDNESTGDGQQDKWLLDTIRATISHVKEGGTK